MPFDFTSTSTGEGTTPIRKKFYMQDAAVIPIGAIGQVSATTGEIALGVSGSGLLIGVSAHGVDNTDDGEQIVVSTNPEAVFSVVDANARVLGEQLDLSSDGLGLTTDNNHDFVVVEPSTATESTYVSFYGSAHFQR